MLLRRRGKRGGEASKFNGSTNLSHDGERERELYSD